MTDWDKPVPDHVLGRAFEAIGTAVRIAVPFPGEPVGDFSKRRAREGLLAAFRVYEIYRRQTERAPTDTLL